MNYDRVIGEMLSSIENLKDQISELSQRIQRIEATSSERADGPAQEKSRDKTRYTFNGKEYLKNRLVLAVVKDYVESAGDITYEDLHEVFSDDLQGSLGVIKKTTEIKDEKRYFGKPEEIIHLSDADCKVCNQWSILNINKFLDFAKNALKYDIETKGSIHVGVDFFEE